MSIKQSYKQAVSALAFTVCLAAAGGGQAQNMGEIGPVRLDGPPSSKQVRTGPIYLLSLVQVTDAKPAEFVWLLQKEIVQPGQPVEVQETAYKSLNATSLRKFVSKLPKGADILCTTSDVPGPNPTMGIGISSYPAFNDFAAFCHSKSIELEFGIPF